MKTSLPEEPVELKKQIITLKSQLDADTTTGIDWNSQAVWFRNGIPKHLWQQWKNELQTKGYTWPKFLRIMRYRTDDAILWLHNKQTWKEYVEKVSEALDGPLGDIVKQ